MKKLKFARILKHENTYLLLLLTLAAMPAFGDGIRCSDATGEFRFHEMGYASGVPPEPGTPVSTVSWFRHNEIVGLSVSFQDEGIRVIRPYAGKFIGQTKKILKQNVEPHSVSTVYTIEAVLPYQGAGEERTFDMLCVETSLAIP